MTADNGQLHLHHQPKGRLQKGKKRAPDRQRACYRTCPTQGVRRSQEDWQGNWAVDGSNSMPGRYIATNIQPEYYKIQKGDSPIKVLSS
jgi:hypothetical protein